MTDHSFDQNSWQIRCVGCGETFPRNGFPYRCKECGGLYDLQEPYSLPQELIGGASVGGMETYRSTFPIPAEGSWVTLGELPTPLVKVQIGNREAYLKCEHLQPTGSFKDRGTVVLVNAMVAAGVTEAIEDSSGNAGSSFAAYAARAGMRARVFVPSYASGPKRRQIEAYGAQVIPVQGPRTQATREAMAAVGGGTAYASHALLPHGMTGIATIAYELLDQLGEPPEEVIVPVGNGTLLLGILRGFRALKNAGSIERIPRLVGVQARACAPFVSAFEQGGRHPAEIVDRETAAEGIRIPSPVRGEVILEAMHASDGLFLAVEEQAILAGRDALARRGLYVETTSAIVWEALSRRIEQVSGVVVCLLTGSGLKSSM